MTTRVYFMQTNSKNLINSEDGKVYFVFIKEFSCLTKYNRMQSKKLGKNTKYKLGWSNFDNPSRLIVKIKVAVMMI